MSSSHTALVKANQSSFAAECDIDTGDIFSIPENLILMPDFGGRILHGVYQKNKITQLAKDKNLYAPDFVMYVGFLQTPEGSNRKNYHAWLYGECIIFMNPWLVKYHKFKKVNHVKNKEEYSK